MEAEAFSENKSSLKLKMQTRPSMSTQLLPQLSPPHLYIPEMWFLVTWFIHR